MIILAWCLGCQYKGLPLLGFESLWSLKVSCFGILEIYTGERASSVSKGVSAFFNHIALIGPCIAVIVLSKPLTQHS